MADVTDEMVEAGLAAWDKDWLIQYGRDEALKLVRAILAAALAVRQGEPVAWVHNEINAAITAKTKAALMAGGGAGESSVAGYTIPAYAHPAPAEPSADMVPVRRDVVEFLRGAAPLDGVWFGDRHPAKIGGLFWWRRSLLAAPASLRYPHGSMGEEA
jgi:hypothetical protein